MQASLKAQASTSQILAPQLRQGLKMLSMNLPELRQELLREMSVNPTIDDVEPTLEKTTVSAKEEEIAAEDRARQPDYPEEEGNSFDSAYLEGINRGEHGFDPEAAERRERFFENQVRSETLAEHLLAQLPISSISEDELPLAEMLIGELDDNGYFAGSLPDIVMVSGESEDRIRAILKKIMELDPVGCGATSHQECLLAQIDLIGDPAMRDTVRKLIERHWRDMALGKLAAIEGDLGLDHAGYAAALVALRTLDPRPGRAYQRSAKGTEYVNPEVHAVRCDDGYMAKVDARSLPKIRVSPKYLAMLEDPATTDETKAYIRERVAAARAIIDAVARRQETITAIAQAIFDAQPGFFTRGLRGLKPLTMQEIADKVGVHYTTVSRTVRDKYASTPKGTVELRQFFTSGYTTDSGEQVAKCDVQERIREMIAAEDGSHPLSDDKISERLKEEGFPVARRTVAKYRTKMMIPNASERRSQ